MPVVTTSGGNATNKAIVAWNNLAAESTITASTSADGYPAINTVDPATYNGWQSTAAPSWVQYDLGSAMAVDIICISAHNLATTATTVWPEYSTDGVSWTAARPSYAALTDDDLIFTIPSATFRYWRLRFTGGIPTIGVVFIAARMEFPHTPVDGYKPLHHARMYEKMFNDSLKGVMLSNRVMAEGAETDVDFGFVPREFADGPLRGFQSHYNQGGTFFYAGYPSGQALDMGYCRAIDTNAVIEVEYIEGAGLASLNFGIHAYVG